MAMVNSGTARMWYGRSCEVRRLDGYRWGLRTTRRPRCATGIRGGWRQSNCGIVGQNADPGGRAELRVPGTRFIGTVAYFPEKYGEAIVRLALDILAGKPTRPVMFMKHTLVTREKLEVLYPNDVLLGMNAFS